MYSDFTRPVTRIFSKWGCCSMGPGSRNETKWTRRGVAGGRAPCIEHLCNLSIKRSNWSLNFMLCRLFSNMSTTQVIKLELNVTMKIQFSLNLVFYVVSKIFIISSNFTILEDRIFMIILIFSAQILWFWVVWTKYWNWGNVSANFKELICF